ncbi:hypothetical protein A0J48_009455 [Sphaerospermopsis aphanizomenoides BCCUSP55]|uniref:hypothetical protein n=1 Tax=Sphaerospermopsis aphanizomenoides TaxID=459663 RepID=UPI0019080250|nr:hypothetical protein [Sphaerospermopsis aphanizomenoides]MBK1987760.1 hypothetical protein [Sphaerospermopsis aphanizomenoides BCCUSP55]
MKYPIITFSLAATLTLFTTVAKAQEQLLLCSLDSANVTSNQTLTKQTKTDIKNSSGAAEIALAKHLKTIKAKMYGAFWCPHCHHQKELFGKQAWATITYIECDPKGTKPRPDLCQKAKIQGYPTWEIKGKKYPGMQSLETIANISGYKGKRNFKN